MSDGEHLDEAASNPAPEAMEEHAAGGLVCHRCGCPHFHVVYTRPRPNGQILRRRECRHCGTRIMTIEQRAGQLP